MSNCSNSTIQPHRPANKTQINPRFQAAESRLLLGSRDPGFTWKRRRSRAVISSFLVSNCGECEDCSVRGPSAGRRPGRGEFAMQSPVQRCVVALLLLGLCNARKGDPTNRSRNVLLIVGEQSNPGGALQTLLRRDPWRDMFAHFSAFVRSCFKKVGSPPKQTSGGCEAS